VTSGGVRSGSVVGARRRRQARRRRALGAFDARRGGAGVCGVDEVGRGPLAGPVVAAAVVLEPGARLVGLDDSKRLTAAAREVMAERVRAGSRSLAIAVVSARRIDAINIRQATFDAMRAAIRQLATAPSLVLVDGEAIPQLDHAQEAVIGGDRRSLAIAAASVVAKVHRDALMCAFDARYPGYGFAANKGYATAEHLAALRTLGPSPIHRHSFAPVRLAAQPSFL